MVRWTQEVRASRSGTIATESAFVLVYPHGLDLGRTACDALDRAGIPPLQGPLPAPGRRCGPPRSSTSSTRRGCSRSGSRATVEHAVLELIHRAQAATTIVLAERGSQSNVARDQPVRRRLGGVPRRRPPALVATVRAAAASLAARDDVRIAQGESERLLRQIGLALSAERDVTKLQQTIVRNARELTRADSGSLYLLEDGENGERVLRFAVAQTGPDDHGAYLGAVLPLSRTSISGYVALGGETVRIDDAYAVPADAEYRVNRSFDKANGYRTMSVLAEPMRDHENAIVGVIMLINRKPDFDLVLTSPAHTEEVVQPFSSRDEHVLRSLASQAAVALENRALLDSIQDLFEQFVRASVKAIEVRDKSTQGHSSRVAELTCLQAEAVNAVKPASSPTCTSTPTKSARCATPRCCTTSAKSRSRNTSSAKQKNSRTAASTRSACASCSPSNKPPTPAGATSSAPCSRTWSTPTNRTSSRWRSATSSTLSRA